LSAAGGDEPGDGGEVGVDDCLGDDGERECSDAARRDGGLMLGALSGDTGLDASLVGLRMM
jgi:hypothetical protein